MTEKFYQLVEMGAPASIKVSGRTLTLAQELTTLMEKKRGQMTQGEFKKETLELLAAYIRPEVFQLAIAMEIKLCEYDRDRGDSWKDLSVEEALDRAQKELAELSRAVSAQHTPEGVWKEAGDAGNYLMFAAHNYESKFNKG